MAFGQFQTHCLSDIPRLVFFLHRASLLDHLNVFFLRHVLFPLSCILLQFDDAIRSLHVRTGLGGYLLSFSTFLWEGQFFHFASAHACRTSLGDAIGGWLSWLISFVFKPGGLGPDWKALESGGHIDRCFCLFPLPNTCAGPAAFQFFFSGGLSFFLSFSPRKEVFSIGQTEDTKIQMMDLNTPYLTYIASMHAAFREMIPTLFCPLPDAKDSRPHKLLFLPNSN